MYSCNKIRLSDKPPSLRARRVGVGWGGVRGVHISKYIHPSGELPDHLQVMRYSLTWAIWICATPKGMVFQLC